MRRTDEPDPRGFTLEAWCALRGTLTGTYTFNGVTYSDMTEVEWRRANNQWA
jgi:hypothetical protein